MGQARHLLSPLALGVALVTLIAAVGGCGSSSDESGSSETNTARSSPPGATVRNCTAKASQNGDRAIAGVGVVRASGIGCAAAWDVASSWNDARPCAAPQRGSRVSCSIAGYRCLGAATDRGLAVSCAAPGRSISFVAKRG